MKDANGHSRPGSQAALRQANRRRVESLLQNDGELSQAEVARRSGLAPATVSNIVRELKSAGVVSVGRSSNQRRVVRLSRGSGLVAGLDYGHRHVTVAVADRTHQVLAEHRADLGAGVPAVEALEVGSSLLDRALADAAVERAAISAVGMGLPAPIAHDTGQVGALSILPGWVGVDAAQLASDHLGIPVAVDNDANLGALAEHLWGAGTDVDDLAFVKLSEGVGAGLILGGELFHGRDGTSGEIGHTTIDDLGAVCRCGNRGCLETIVAARSVVELLEPHHGANLTIANVVRRATEGDTACARVLADTGHHAGLALANLCNLLNLERIVIGGELAQAGDLLLAPIRESVRRCGIPSATANLQIATGALGPRATLLGAIALALDHAPLP